MIIQSVTLPAIAWLASKVKLPITAEFKGIEAMTDDGEPVGVIVFDKWTFNSVRIHIAAVVPSRELAKAALEYAFVQADKGVLLAEIPAKAEVPLKIAKYFGFKRVYSIKDGWKEDEDLIVMELRRDDWRKMEAH